jgi:hypothetical protein
MTQQRDLKRRIRERMAKTGEAYVTARQHVLAARDDDPAEPAPASVFDVVEPIDVSDDATALGLKCQVSIFPKLAARVDAISALTRLRDALLDTEDDSSLSVMQRLVLHGVVPPAAIGEEFRDFYVLRNFVRRARAGIGGASPRGRMLALPVHDVMMICVASKTRHGGPIAYLHGIDEIVGQRNLIGFVR